MVSNPYYQFSMCFQRLYPYAIFRLHKQADSTKVSKIAYLTFDDGPIPEVTPRVLDILKQYGVKATFFMVGENIDKYPDLYRRVLTEGHAIGNHTYHHVKGMKMSTTKYMEEVIKWEKAVEQHGAPSTRLFRPPYGRTWWWQRKAITQRGYQIYLWDVLTHDYSACQSPEKMMKAIQRYTRNGSIINFHDSIKSNERMLATLPKAIDYLQSHGYTLLPLQ